MSTSEKYFTSGDKVVVMAWLFTIGFMDLDFWQAVWALVIWPYYLGVAAARFVWETGVGG